jgi:UDP-perosamine 4-acetyltransferase
VIGPGIQDILRSDLRRAVVVVGAGGHAKVAIEALRYSGWTVVGCTDFDPTARSIVGAPLLGQDELLPQLREAGVQFAFPALGGNQLRESMAERLINLGFDLPSAIGPNVACSPTATIGAGVAIFGGATVNADASIGDYAIINTNASIDHDCVIGRAAHIAPGCALAGRIKVGDRTFVGAGTTIIPGISIGADTMVGAGSVVVRDLPGGVTAFGVPARVQTA